MLSSSLTNLFPDSEVLLLEKALGLKFSHAAFQCPKNIMKAS